MNQYHGERIDAAKLYSCFTRANQFYKLNEAARQMRISSEQQHRAINNCRLTLTIIQKIAEKALG